jgi:hypothetical protein
MPTFYIIRHARKELGDFYNPRLRHDDEPIRMVESFVPEVGNTRS